MTFDSVKDNERWKSFLYTFGIVTLAIIAYYPAILGGFIWDDDNYVTANLTLRTLQGLKEIWFEPGAVPQYYPLVHTSFWIEYQLWGPDPVGYHIVNVLLHISSALLVRVLLQRLAVPGAWLAAAVFAFHPVHVESVAWVTERKNVLSALFYISSLLTYLKFSDNPKPDRDPRVYARIYGVAFMFYLCALLSKTVSCSLPVTMMLILWWRYPQLSWKQLIPLVPFFVVGLGFGLFTIHMEKTNVGATGPEWDISFAERVLIAGRALWFYIGKLLWPVSLIFSYPRWEIQVSEWRSWGYLVSYVFTLAGLFFGRLRLGKGPITALLIYSVTIFPALGFFDIYPMRYSFVADHFQYLASISIIALFSSVLISLCTNSVEATQIDRKQSNPDSTGRTVAGEDSAGPVKSLIAAGMHSRQTNSGWLGAAVISCVIILTLGVSSWVRCHAFKDSETLWKDTISKNSRSWMAHNNLGLIYESQQRFDEAIYHYENTIKLKPDHAAAYNNLGMVWEKKGEFTKALESFRDALVLKPGDLRILNNVANFLSRQKRFEQALVLYERALGISEKSIPTLVNLGILRARQQKIDLAITLFSRVLEIDPDNSSALYNLKLAISNRNNQ